MQWSGASAGNFRSRGIPKRWQKWLWARQTSPYGQTSEIEAPEIFQFNTCIFKRSYACNRTILRTYFFISNSLGLCFLWAAGQRWIHGTRCPGVIHVSVLARSCLGGVLIILGGVSVMFWWCLLHCSLVSLMIAVSVLALLMIRIRVPASCLALVGILVVIFVVVLAKLVMCLELVMDL